MRIASANGYTPAVPHFDLDYTVDEFSGDAQPDSQFLYKRLADVILSEATVEGGRTLDVACGVGQVSIGVRQRGGDAIGLDPSKDMLGVCRWVYPEDEVPLVRGVSETLPFRSGSFDRVVCQCSLDHFVDPQAFMREAARVVKPDGQIVIALANYESLSCRVGRARYRIAQWMHRASPARPYFQPPPDHFHKGELSFVRSLGGETLELERCQGVSMFWLSYNWGSLLQRLPSPLSRGVLAVLDRIARPAPGLADIIISVWRPLAPAAAPEHVAATNGHAKNGRALTPEAAAGTLRSLLPK